jgi:hypothetical protein
MPLFNIFRSKKPSVKTNFASEDDFAKDFVNQRCQCVQQELDLSELTWFDTSVLPRIKKIQQMDMHIPIRTYLGFDPQRDLFE